MNAIRSLVRFLFTGWRKSGSMRWGMVIIGLILLAVIIAPLVQPISPDTMVVRDRLQRPSRQHLLGTDHMGRDVFSRTVFGAWLSLSIGLATAVGATLAGVVIGLVGAFFRRWDAVVMRIMDSLMAFPALLLALALVATVGPGLSNVIVALIIVYTPRVARVMRGAALIVREETYIESAHAIGAGSARILWTHMLPNCFGPIVVQSTFIYAYSVLTEASLSFLGAGIPPWVPSWGTILSEGRQFLGRAPWMTLSAGSLIALTILGLNLLGDGIRDMLDPRLRQRGDWE